MNETDPLGTLRWRKSSRSNGQGECVEVTPFDPAPKPPATEAQAFHGVPVRRSYASM